MRISRENLKNNRIVRNSYYSLRGLISKKRLWNKAANTLTRFGIDFSSNEERDKCISDMILMNRKYGYGFDEYLYYHFSVKNLAERRSFVADWEHLGYTCVMNNPDNSSIFDNKWMTYQTYKEFYKRKVAYCEGDKGLSVFREFVSNHHDFVLKPLDSSCGHGFQIVHTKDQLCDELYYRIISNKYNGRFIIEEIIIQSEAMRKLHPASVNTVRVPTINVGGEINIVHPFLRIGQHGNHVDNAGSGGIICALDAETGIVFAAADEHGNRFEKHPDTGEEIIGFTVPRWEEAKKIVKELAEIKPDNHYTGWDLSLTDSGWILVEANRRGQFIWQIASQVGFRDEVNYYLKQLGLKY